MATNKPDFNLSAITSSYNHRFPLNAKLRELGYGIFKTDVPPGSDKMPLWDMALSNDPVRRAEYVQLINQYDGGAADGDDDIENTGQNGSLKALAQNMMALGQLEPIGVRSNGGKKEKEVETFQLVYGHRRSLAWLYLYCQGIVKSPMAWATKVTGNHQALQSMALAENVFRKGLSRMERAKAYSEQINGGAKYEDIAEREGVDPGTIRNFIKLTELPATFHMAIDSKVLPMGVAIAAMNNVRDTVGISSNPIEQTKAIAEEIKRITSSKGTGGGAGGGGGRGKKLRSRKEIEERFANAKSKIARVELAWVLMESEGGSETSELLPEDLPLMK